MRAKILKDFEAKNAEKTEAHCYALLGDDNTVFVDDMFDDERRCDEFCSRFFPEQGSAFKWWIKQVFGHREDKEEALKEFFECVRNNRPYNNMFALGEGWREDFTRAEARNFFVREIIPYDDASEQTWRYFEHRMLFRGEAGPKIKKIKSDN